MNEKLPILKLIPAGFGLIVFAVLIYSFISVGWVSDLTDSTDRAASLRVPTAAASSRMVNEINAALGALRGWLLLGEVRFEDELRIAWQGIRRAEEDMIALSAAWTNPQNVTRLKKLQSLLNKFEKKQLTVQRLNRSNENVPASRMLLQEAVPLATLMREHINILIEFENSQPVRHESRKLIALLADFRGSLGFALADIRAFLISPEERFKRGFNTNWEKTKKVLPGWKRWQKS